MARKSFKHLLARKNAGEPSNAAASKDASVEALQEEVQRLQQSLGTLSIINSLAVGMSEAASPRAGATVGESSSPCRRQSRGDPQRRSLAGRAELRSADHFQTHLLDGEETRRHAFRMSRIRRSCRIRTAFRLSDSVCASHLPGCRESFSSARRIH